MKKKVISRYNTRYNTITWINVGINSAEYSFDFFLCLINLECARFGVISSEAVIISDNFD